MLSGYTLGNIIPFFVRPVKGDFAGFQKVFLPFFLISACYSRHNSLYLCIIGSGR